MKRTPATLSDVAARAGVSKATASKVFNGRPDVASGTRDRVTAAASQLGYLPPVRPVAAGLTQVWVVLDSLANAYSATVLDALLSEAQRQGATVVTSLTSGLPGPGPRPGSPEWLRQSLRWGAQAFVLITTPLSRAHVQACAERGAPLVVVDPASHAPEGVMSIGATNWRGGRQATDHLLELGHRRLAFIGAPESSTPGAERIAGFRMALQAAGVDPDTAPVLAGGFGYDDGVAARSLLEAPSRPTGIFAASDAVALGVIEAARQAGLRVPEDLSVVGFDDSYTAVLSSPQLTTVRQPLVQMGRLAIRAAVSAVRGDAPTPPVELATVLVERGSTGPAPVLS